MKKATAVGGAVRLCRPDSDVLDILRLTRTAGLFEVFDDEHDAVASFPSG
jgi:hypothetical protein